jgi:hypothetical protein
MHFKIDSKDEHDPDNLARHKKFQQAGEFPERIAGKSYCMFDSDC